MKDSQPERMRRNHSDALSAKSLDILLVTAPHPQTPAEHAATNTELQTATHTNWNSAPIARPTITQAGIEDALNSSDAWKPSMTTSQKTGCPTTQLKLPGLKSPIFHEQTVLNLNLRLRLHLKLRFEFGFGFETIRKKRGASPNQSLFNFQILA